MNLVYELEEEGDPELAAFIRKAIEDNTSPHVDEDAEYERFLNRLDRTRGDHD